MSTPSRYSRTRWPRRVWASVSVEADDALHALAAATGRPLAEVTREALTVGLRALQKRRRERRRRRAAQDAEA